MAASGEVTQLLIDYGADKRESLDALLPLVYDELRRIAASYLNRERADHTLQPTALVHEAYLRLVNQHSVDWRNRAQFYGLAAQMMRRILVNHAEKKRAEKRGSGGEKVLLDETMAITEELNLDLLALDEALKQLTQLDEIKARIVALKIFGGLKTEEIAEVVGKSTRTVEREWMLARGWLFKTLSDTKANEESRLGKTE
jgi:RNA polymerase sigma-70 factor, ECF subfamily